MTTPTIEQIRQAPKVLLHDHLDGGLRPQTLLELADQIGYAGLPTTESAEALESAIHHEAQGVDLATYLNTFRHTIAVLQTAEALERVAEECATDLAADGVIYAEVRFAPESHTKGQMNLDDAIEAERAGSGSRHWDTFAEAFPGRTADSSEGARFIGSSMGV